MNLEPQNSYSFVTVTNDDKNVHKIVLPIEISLYLFSFLNYFELIAAESTCRVWREAASDSVLWKAHYLKLSNGWCPDKAPDSWKVLIKRTFYLEWCIWEYEKFLGDQEQGPIFDYQKRRLTARIGIFSYLESAENTRYVLYNLCGGPQFFYQLPVSDGIYDPSIFRKSGEGYKISRDPDQDIIRFSYSRKNGQHTTFGVSKVYFSPERNEVLCEFSPFLKGLDHKTWTLVKKGLIPNRRKFESIRNFIQFKVCQQLGITASSPASSGPEESTPDQSHALSRGE